MTGICRSFFIMLIDTHAHLSELVGLQNTPHTVVSVSTGYLNALSTLRIAQQFQNVIPAFGLHPWFIRSDWQNELAQIFSLYLESTPSKIMGEIGLDFSKLANVDKSTQLSVFTEQLRFAYDHNLTVSVHCVKAFDECLKLLKLYPVNCIMHGFSGSFEQACMFTRQGCKIGINSLIMRSNTPKYQRLVQLLPIDYIVIETDAPFISYPNTKPGDLLMLPFLLQTLSCLKSMDVAEVESIIYKNSLEALQIA
jgi:TatD DNase family protein